MKKILFFSIIFIFLFGCGRKSIPEYEYKESRLEQNIIIKIVKI